MSALHKNRVALIRRHFNSRFGPYDASENCPSAIFLMAVIWAFWFGEIWIAHPTHNNWANKRGNGQDVGSGPLIA
jgi:hypothetical protein